MLTAGNARLMVTDGGPHSAEDWAEVTADQIIDIASTAPETRVQEALAFRSKLIGILTGHHGKVQESERSAIQSAGGDRLIAALDPSEHVEDPVKEIVAAAAGYSFADHFKKPETQGYLRRVLGSHFATSMNIEREWHARRNPAAAQSQAFLAQHHPGETGGVP